MGPEQNTLAKSIIAKYVLVSGWIEMAILIILEMGLLMGETATLRWPSSTVRDHSFFLGLGTGC